MATTKKTSTKKTTEKGEKFSTNKKLNTVLNDIYDQLLECSDSKKESIELVKDYKKKFPKEIDFNIVQYGELLCYYDDIRKMYVNAGYTSMKKMDNDQIWETYKKQVGYVVKTAKIFKQ